MFKKILDKTNIVEMIASALILANTIVLLVIRDTISYELQETFEPTQKSSVITIIQHNPILGYVYLICGIILLCSGIYRLYDTRAKNTKEEM